MELESLGTQDHQETATHYSVLGYKLISLFIFLTLLALLSSGLYLSIVALPVIALQISVGLGLAALPSALIAALPIFAVSGLLLGFLYLHWQGALEIGDNPIKYLTMFLLLGQSWWLSRDKLSQLFPPKEGDPLSKMDLYRYVAICAFPLALALSIFLMVKLSSMLLFLLPAVLGTPFVVQVLFLALMALGFIALSYQALTFLMGLAIDIGWFIYKRISTDTDLEPVPLDTRSSAREFDSEKPDAKRASSKDKLRIMLLGSPGVGKTALAKRFSCPDEKELYSNDDSLDNIVHRIRFNADALGQKTLEIWDVSERGEAWLPQQCFLLQCLPLSQGVMVAYNPANRESYEQALARVDGLQSKYAFPIILVACQIDQKLEGSVPPEEAADAARARAISFAETSAKTGEGVNEAFRALISRILSLEVEAERGFEL